MMFLMPSIRHLGVCTFEYDFALYTLIQEIYNSLIRSRQNLFPVGTKILTKILFFCNFGFYQSIGQPLREIFNQPRAVLLAEITALTIIRPEKF